MLRIRKPEDIYQIDGKVQHGMFHGRWHFSFSDYYDREFVHFGTLRVFNDDTLSPGGYASSASCFRIPLFVSSTIGV